MSAKQQPSVDLNAFLEISTAVNASLDLLEICATACTIARDRVRVTHASLALLDAAGRNGIVHGEDPDSMGTLNARIRFDLSFEGQDLVTANRPIEIPDLRDVRPGGFRDNLLKLGVTSALIVPLIRDGCFLGSLNLASIGAPRDFAESEKRYCTLFASQIAIAIHNSLQHQASERRGKQLEALRKAILPILTESDREALLRSIIEQAVHLLGARSGGIHEYSPSTRELRVIATHGSDQFRGKIIRVGEGLAGRLLEARQPHMIVNDYQNWDGKAPAFSDVTSFECVLGVLLMRADDDPLGVLYLEAPYERPFTDQDAELLKLFSEPAAIALINSELKQQRNERAHLEARRTEMLEKLNDLNFGDELSIRGLRPCQHCPVSGPA